MNIEQLNLEQLDSQDLINIEAGGFFYDLGAAAHRAWNSFNEFMHKCEYRHYSKLGL
jgi:hypothetical protein